MVEPLSKNNLTLQIEKTAGKLAKQNKRASASDDTGEQSETLKQELIELQHKKIDAKLFHARKELKATFKKCRAMELQKQIKRIREAQKSAESAEPSDEAPATEEGADIVKKEKKRTKDDIPRLENERDVLKNLDLDALAERSLRNKILKHEELGQNEVVKSASTLAESAAPAIETNKVVLDMGARLLRHKAAQEQFTKLISSIKFILDPTAPEHQQQRQQRAAGKKRRNEEQPASNSNHNYTASSMFVESLGGGSDRERPRPKKNKSGLEWEDPDFDKYYFGEEKKKPNRMGQRNRRKLFEEQYGKEANHIKEARKLKQHLGKKGIKKDVQSKPAPKPKQQNIEEFHPSWQAKRQQQEMMAAALSGAAKPANKKIVFD